MRSSTAAILIISSPFIAIGVAAAVLGIGIVVSVDTIVRVTCSHDWKYVGFNSYRTEGQYERECKSCRKCEWTNEVDKESLMYKIANLELK